MFFMQQMDSNIFGLVKEYSSNVQYIFWEIKNAIWKVMDAMAEHGKIWWDKASQD